MEYIEHLQTVSVPIRGLFNLTSEWNALDDFLSRSAVSVPIRGLFNLTRKEQKKMTREEQLSFRPHQGII